MVENLHTGGGVSAPVSIISGSSTSPTITSINPSSGTQGTVVSATLVGTNLMDATSVTFSGSGISALIQPGRTATRLGLVITVSADAAPGQRAVTVSTAAGSFTALSLFNVQAANPIVPRTPPQSIPEVEEGNIRSGYVIITPDSGSATASASATFGIVNGGVVQAQAGILPSLMTTDASLFVEVIPDIGRNVGVAIANPGGSTNTVTLTLRDANGNSVGGSVTVPLQPRQQVARFVNELFPGDVVGSGFRGSLRLQSSTAFAVLGLRFSGAEFSTLAAAAGSTVSGVPARENIGGSEAIILPQFAISGGWATQIALVNNAGRTITGRIDISDTAGNPMAVKLNGLTQSTFSYSIPANGTFVLVPRDSNGQSPF